MRSTSAWVRAAPARVELRIHPVSEAVMSRLTVLTPPGWQGPADGAPLLGHNGRRLGTTAPAGEPIYDPPQQEPLLPGGAEVMPTMCATACIPSRLP